MMDMFYGFDSIEQEENHNQVDSFAANEEEIVIREGSKLTKEQVAAAQARNIAEGVLELQNPEIIERAAIKQARNSLSMK